MFVEMMFFTCSNDVISEIFRKGFASCFKCYSDYVEKFESRIPVLLMGKTMLYLNMFFIPRLVPP